MTRPAVRRASAALAVLAVAAAAGCGSRSSPAGGANTPKAQENRKLAESYAVAAVVGGAGAEARAHPEMVKKGLINSGVTFVKDLLGLPSAPAATAPPPAPPGPPAPPTPTVTVVRVETPPKPVPPPSGAVLVRERVGAELPAKTEAEAEEATVAAAADRLAEAFAKLDPPLDYRPSPAAVKSDYLRKDSRHVRPPTEAEKAALAKLGYAEDRVYVEYTMEATAEQVRAVRGRERLAGALKVFGLLAAAAAVGFGFLRVDEWSQGYLTSWLAFIAAALAGGTVVAFLFA
jgi:hypothetical protein